MARKNNFLLGFGERLTSKVEVPTGGGDKNPPYTFSQARARVEGWLTSSVASFNALANDAAPNDEVVATLTLHPRYVSKSDFPRELLESTGLRAVGSRIERVSPENWGVEDHPEAAYTETLYVAGTRTRFREWQSQLPRWSEAQKGADTLSHIENLSAFESLSKLKGFPENDRDGVLEVVLHNAGDQRIIEAFAAYVLQHGGEPLRKYRRDVRGLTFFPVRTTFSRAEEIARYSFVRVARPMPVLRPSNPFLVRSLPSAQRAIIPQTGPIDPTVKAVVFDGGIPQLSRAALSRWVNYIEPAGIGPAVPDLENHGLAVTSALLFGQADGTKPFDTPLCSVDHVRVLDNATGANGDLMCLDVLDRILNHLDANPTYEFINISLGPQFPCEDEDVTEWTATLDERFAGGRVVATIATGNDGDRDQASGAHRIQPPSQSVQPTWFGQLLNEQPQDNSPWLEQPVPRAVLGHIERLNVIRDRLRDHPGI